MNAAPLCALALCGAVVLQLATRTLREPE